MEADTQLLQQEITAALSADTWPTKDTPRTVSAEWLAYFALAFLALVLRIGELDSVPLTNFEAQQSLHAWHTVFENAPGSYSVAQSPLTYLSQVLSYSTLGASAFSARIGVALAGVALAMSPLLFRKTLGITRTFVWSVLLSLLTLPVITARAADGTTWMMLFTVLAIWMIRRYWYSHSLADAMWASAFATFMLLLSSPSGIPLFMILLVSGWLAVWRTALSAPQRLDLPGDDILQLSLKRLNSFPYMQIAIVPIAVIFLTATAMMLNPGGMRSVGKLINAFITGLTQASSGNGPSQGLVSLLTFEPLLIVFALGGSWLLWRHGAVSYIDRFAAAWASSATLGLLLYSASRPADAMWVVLPMSLLASYGITQLMVNRRVAALWPAGEISDEVEGHDIYTTRYWWVKWAISAGVLLLLMVASVHFLQIARALLDVPADAGLGNLLERLSVASYPRLAQGLGLLATTAIVALVLFMLGVSIWGTGTCLQGIGIGFLWFLLLSGIGGAWKSSVAGATDSASLWHDGAVSKDTELLRETLMELADRSTAGFPLIDLVIVSDEAGILSKEGLISWLVRDFPNARFVDNVASAAGQPIIINAHSGEDPPKLEGDYVGQRFVLRRKISLASLNAWQLPAWWSQRRLRNAIETEDAIILWIRQDIYDGMSDNE